MRHWMRALLVVVPLAMAMALVTAACETQSPPASNPGQGGTGARISVDSDTVDFGRVPLDKEVRHTFNIKNVGSQDLTVRDINVKTVQGC